MPRQNSNRSSTDPFEVGRATLDAIGVDLERDAGRYRVRSRAGDAEAVADDLLTVIELGTVIGKHAILARAFRPQRRRAATPTDGSAPG